MRAVLEIVSFCFHFLQWKFTVNENVSFADYASGIRLLDCSKLSINRENDNDATTCLHNVIVKLFWRCLFRLSSLLTGLSFMLISSLILELWQFTLIRDWPKTRKSEIPRSEFCSISGDWGELKIPQFVQMFLMKFYLVLQNARVTAFIVSELLRENQQGGKNNPYYPD